MFGTIARAAGLNGLFWGVVGSLACKEIEGVKSEAIIKGGIISTITGVALVLIKPVIYGYAKQYNLEDYKIHALAFGTRQAIHAAAIYALYASGIVESEMFLITIPVMSTAAVFFDSSLATAYKTWGSGDKKIIESSNFLLDNA